MGKREAQEKYYFPGQLSMVRARAMEGKRLDVLMADH
jgi:hypothetical protein